ncbi:MAG: transcription-repair coupling factor [Planctomycetota bacterium]|jgi:transcription-repair coupling factor (superfamily II helicase)|nr:transcription-repair coupling factor [Planctomycetota bacterium]
MSKPDPPLAISDWARELASALADGDALLRNARGSALAKCLADALGRLDRPLLVVAPDPEVAIDIFNDIRFYLQSDDPHPLFWPAWDILPSETDMPDVNTASDQVAVLKTCLQATRPPCVVTAVTALLQPTIAPEVLRRGGLRVCRGSAISPEAVVAHLVEGGLEAVAQVDGPGQFSRRGGIVDVFPLLGDIPYRLEFFGDEIATIRGFDPGTQESGPTAAGEATLVDISRDAFRNARDGKRRHSLLDYLGEDAAAILWHPDRIGRVAGLYASGFSEKDELIAFEEAAARIGGLRLCAAPDLDGDAWPESVWRRPQRLSVLDFGALGWERLSGGFDTSLKELSLLLEKGLELVIACNNAAEEKRLKQVLEEKLPYLPRRASLVVGKLSRGFIREGAHGAAYVSDHELFGRQTPVRTARKRFSGAPIADFAELRGGDYVVHVANGIGRFEGIRTLKRNGAERDFLALCFAEEARIYIPLSHIDLVQRYIGLGGHRPQLSKLGSAAWNRRKAAAEKAVRDIAQDLLATQAERLSSVGVALPEDDGLVLEFDASFPYDETPDQLAASEDIRRDQQRTAPMERLLCGDVGFGKTELAVRAAFRVANAGKQTAVLVPTTILAEQHFRTFSERMADYPVAVECLSRFRSPNDQKRIVENIRAGRTDIVVGTHRLLSDDVAFKNLGLVVIDEEQKFGVESKERLKRFRADVDILTMTATPIPRTLHMSLLGLRDISNLATPPRERHSVKTMVVRWSDDVIRRGILRELSRGGQCFFLHNRVYNIDEMAARLRHLVPEARFATGHGQMAEGELLEVMTRFLDGKIDVLVCTTIIESGVDIPKVNTLFVNDADRFGLSELHQLRGRVGRYRHQAYSYFLVPKNRPVNPEAHKRLQALQEYAELGAGFRIAMRDLEIRGAGNLLGFEQSGHIHMIGFDLYCRLLEKAVSAQKGETVEEDVPAELDIGASAFIPPEYIPSEPQRIEFYRRLSRVRTPADLETTKNYARDRYGPLPPPVEKCFRDQGLRVRMMGAGVESLSIMDGALAVGLDPKAVKRGVMLLRHAGLKTTPLTRNRWRVEMSGVEKRIDPGETAALMADKALAVLEDATPERSPRASPRSRREPAREHPEPGQKAAVPENPEHLDFFGSDQLDDPKLDSLEGEPVARPAKKTRGKSGAGGKSAAKEKPKPRKRDGAGGGVKKTLSLPLAAKGAGILSLSPNRKPASTPSPPTAKPAGGSGKKTAPPADPQEEEGAGRRVFGVEPRIAQGEIGVVVSARTVVKERFGPMTLAVGGDNPRRYFLRATGMGRNPSGRSVLILKTSGPDETQAIAESYLRAGEATLFDGIAE